MLGSQSLLRAQDRDGETCTSDAEVQEGADEFDRLRREPIPDGRKEGSGDIKLLGFPKDGVWLFRCT